MNDSQSWQKSSVLLKQIISFCQSQISIEKKICIEILTLIRYILGDLDFAKALTACLGTIIKKIQTEKCKH